MEFEILLSGSSTTEPLSIYCLLQKKAKKIQFISGLGKYFLQTIP